MLRRIGFRHLEAEFAHGENTMITERIAFEWNDSVRTYLKAGKKVVYIPPFNKVGGRKGDFHNHFWNPLMFKWDPMTLGCLIHLGFESDAQFLIAVVRVDGLDERTQK